MIRSLMLVACSLMLAISGFAQQDVKLKKKDRKRDIEMVTSEGTIVLRLSDSTPLHRDNFLRLVKTKYYDSVLFHRVIQNFMIQAGDPNSKSAAAGVALGEGGPAYRVPAEFRTTLFHKKGVLAAARDNNPEKSSSGSQFYIVQGKKWTDETLDQLQQNRLKGRQIPAWQREVYKTVGGTPHLDQNYTVYGEVVKGIEMVDMIAAVKTAPGDRPVEDVKMEVSVLKKKEARKLEK